MSFTKFFLTSDSKRLENIGFWERMTHIKYVHTYCQLI